MKGSRSKSTFLLLQTEFVGDLSKMGIKYRMLDMAGLENLKNSRPEEPCPVFATVGDTGIKIPGQRSLWRLGS